MQHLEEQTHPASYASHIMRGREGHDRTHLEKPSFKYAPSEDSKENDSMLTQNSPASEGRTAESLIVDTNIEGVQRDSWPDIEILEEQFTANLKRRRCFIWSLFLLTSFGVVIGVSITMTSPWTKSTASMDSCSIDNILNDCYENKKYQVEIPSCMVGRYQALRQIFLDFNMPDEKSCSSENLALLSVANSTNDIIDNTTLLQRYGLSLLYFATKGRQWKDRRDWLSDVSFCHWGSTHVSCSSDGLVLKISLEANNLRGSLPSNLLTFLPQLNYLNAESNSLTGPIPSDLSRLSVLILENNALSGTIPKSIVESETMDIFSISQNDISFDRTYNFFSGSQWRYLSLGRVVNIPTGSIPSEISKLTNLQHLDLSFSSMNGTLPSELGLLQKLTSLDISGNTLTGTIPTELGNMVQLQSLTLYMNLLSGTIPSEIGKLKRMKYIYLDSNLLHGVIPSEISLLVNLVELSLSNNKLTGQFPEDIRKLTNLVVFKFAPNNFYEFDPTDLCELKENGKLITLGTSNSIHCFDKFNKSVCSDSILECCNDQSFNCTSQNS